MKLWKLALLAFGAMCAQDVFNTAMVIAEAHFNAPVAGAFDVLGWLLALVSMGLAIDEIVKRGLTFRAKVIIVAVSLANFSGTYLGVLIGKGVTH